MSIHHSRHLPATLVAGLALAGCWGTPSSFPPDVARAATDTPPQFQPTDPTPRPGCRTPMVDPRDRTEIRLIRSVAPRGDYTVPEGRYGVHAEELLRLDCTTGAPLGVVRR